MTAVAAEDYTFRVWVGCLACYNEGRLLGDWFAAESCPEEVEEFNKEVKVPAVHVAEGHEELWVFDHENSPVAGEYSPMAAAEYARWVELLEPSDMEAFRAYLSNGYDFDEDAVENFQDAYQGEYGSNIEFAQELADQIDAIPEDLPWPISCIDWDHAARELMYDYFEENGYYFRSM